MQLFIDAPITGAAFDALGRRAVAARVVELLGGVGPAQPVVIGITGGPGTGKTSVFNLTAELLADQPTTQSFALDAWTATDAVRFSDAFSSEVSRLFSREGVVGSADKLRDRLVSVGDMVSGVVRLAGVKVDVKGALERSPDSLRVEVMRLTEALGKRIVVFVDHLDRVPPKDALAILQLIERWGVFPYFAFVIAFDRMKLFDSLRRAEADVSTFERIVTVEFPLPPADRADLAAWVRSALVDLAAELDTSPDPALALFAADDGPGVDAIPTLRAAKRLLNSLTAMQPPDLAAACRQLLAL